MDYDILKNRVKIGLEKNSDYFIIALIVVIAFVIIIAAIKQIKIIKDEDFTKLSTNSEEFVDKEEEYEAINNILNNDILDEKEDNSTIKVHIDGDVLNPGVVEIPQDSRLQDAVEEVGGLNKDAVTKNINLASKLEDGQKVYIPSSQEIEDNKNILQEEEFLDNNKNGKININNASIDELQKIDGVGPSLANRIYQYRIKNGKFESIDELKNVSGIGDKKIDAIRDSISL
jgi:competence protein ComEA